MMETAGQVLAKKKSGAFTISPDRSVYEAVQEMAERNVGALLVTEGVQIVGIISERDYIRKVSLKGLSSRDMKVRDVMSSRVFRISEDRTAEECLSLMIQMHIRHLPVMSGKRVDGVISMRDLVRSILSEKEYQIQQLQDRMLRAGLSPSLSGP